MSMKDFRKSNQGSPGPRIVGAASIDGGSPPVILDRTQGQEGTPVEVRVHAETVIESDRIRSPKRNKSDPEVRVRTGSGEEWDRVKRGDD